MSYTPIPKGTDPWDEQVNAAFTDQDQRITDNSAAIVTNGEDIATNTQNIADNTANIVTNTNDIATNTADIAAVELVNDQQWNDITINRNNVAGLKNGQWTPANQNLIAWSMDPSQAANPLNLASGTIVFIGLQISAAATITSAVLVVNTAGSGLTAGQNLVGLYDSAGNRLGVSADQSSNWTSTGIKTIPLTSPVSVTPGVYYVAVMSNGTTPIATVRETNLAIGVINVGLTAATARVAELAAQTTLPTTVTPSSRTLGNSSMWVAVS